MDWKQVIKRNREALAIVIAGLIAMVSSRLDRRSKSTIRRIVDRSANAGTLQGSGGPAAEITLPRLVRLSIYRILRPAESALRRLIVIVAATLQGKARKAEAIKGPLPDFTSFTRHDRRAAFRLIDPRKRFGPTSQPTVIPHALPRISVPGLSDSMRTEKPEDAFNTAALCRRIESLNSALKTLPRQARRLNRLMARRSHAKPGPTRVGPTRVGPIRPGHPPGFRKRPTEPVDDILRDCHFLALESGFKPP